MSWCALTKFAIWFLLNPISTSGAFFDRQHHALSSLRRAVSTVKENRTTESSWYKRIEPDAEEIAAEANESWKQATEDASKIAQISPRKVVEDDMKLLERYYFPGKKPNLERRWLEMIFVVLAFVWFFVFRWKLFRDDHDETLHPSHHESPRPVNNTAYMIPDVVLVFPDPSTAPDKDKQVRVNAIKIALASKVARLDRMAQLHLEIMNPGEQEWSARGSMTPRTYARLMNETDSKRTESIRNSIGFTRQLSRLRGSGTPSDSPSGSPQASPSGTRDQDRSYFVVRACLIQDLYEDLSRNGFDVVVFKSSDDMELYLCIKLSAPGAIRSHLKRWHGKLQLREDVVMKELEIRLQTNKHHSSPPYIAYDEHLSQNVLGSDRNDLDLFRSFGHHSNRVPLVLSDAERIRIIYEHLNKRIDLDFAEQEGLMSGWYPGHDEMWRGLLEKAWGSWRLLFDPTIKQPVSAINEYFGSRFAFMMAWNGFYAKLLLALTPMALLYELMNVGSESVLASVWVRGSVAGFSLVVAMWGRIASNWRVSDEAYAKVLWDVSKAQSLVHPHFTGVFRKSPIDENLPMELHYSSKLYALRKFVAWTITFIFCFAVFVVVTAWLDLFKAKKPIVASIFLSGVVLVFTAIYDEMSEKLTLFENHKLVLDYYKSYLKKQFVFQFVAQYTPFFHIALKAQNDAGGCPHGDCVTYLRVMLVWTLPMLALMRLGLYIVSKLRYTLKHWEKSQSKATLNRVEETIEDQFKLETFGVREEIEHMTTLALTLGHVLIFGGVAPIAIPLCFLVFTFQLRAAAVALTTTTRRVFPYKTDGMKPWREITDFLGTVGVVFSGYLLVQFGPLFDGVEMMTKMSGLIIYFALVRLLWWLCDGVYPRDSDIAELLQSRREHVQHTLVHKNEDAKCPKHDSKPVVQRDEEMTKSSQLELPPHYDHVICGRWDKIPHTITGLSARKETPRSASDEVFHRQYSRNDLSA